MRTFRLLAVSTVLLITYPYGPVKCEGEEGWTNANNPVEDIGQDPATEPTHNDQDWKTENQEAIDHSTIGVSPPQDGWQNGEQESSGIANAITEASNGPGWSDHPSETNSQAPSNEQEWKNEDHNQAESTISDSHDLEHQHPTPSDQESSEAAVAGDGHHNDSNGYDSHGNGSTDLGTSGVTTPIDSHDEQGQNHGHSEDWGMETTPGGEYRWNSTDEPHGHSSTESGNSQITISIDNPNNDPTENDVSFTPTESPGSTESSGTAIPPNGLTERQDSGTTTPGDSSTWAVQRTTPEIGSFGTTPGDGFRQDDSGMPSTSEEHVASHTPEGSGITEHWNSGTTLPGDSSTWAVERTTPEIGSFGTTPGGGFRHDDSGMPSTSEEASHTPEGSGITEQWDSGTTLSGASSTWAVKRTTPKIGSFGRTPGDGFRQDDSGMPSTSEKHVASYTPAGSGITEQWDSGTTLSGASSTWAVKRTTPKIGSFGRTPGDGFRQDDSGMPSTSEEHVASHTPEGSGITEHWDSGTTLSGASSTWAVKRTTPEIGSFGTTPGDGFRQDDSEMPSTSEEHLASRTPEDPGMTTASGWTDDHDMASSDDHSWKNDDQGTTTGSYDSTSDSPLQYDDPQYDGQSPPPPDYDQATLGNDYGEIPEDEPDKSGDELVAACKRESNYQGDFQDPNESSTELKCFYACAMVKMQVMNEENGQMQLNMQTTVNMIEDAFGDNSDMIEKYKNAVSTCDQEVQKGGDRCEYSFNFINCGIQKVQ